MPTIVIGDRKYKWIVLRKSQIIRIDQNVMTEIQLIFTLLLMGPIMFLGLEPSTLSFGGFLELNYLYTLNFTHYAIYLMVLQDLCFRVQSLNTTYLAFQVPIPLNVP